MRWLVLVSALLFPMAALSESSLGGLSEATDAAADAAPGLNWDNDVKLLADVDNDSNRDYLLVGLGHGSFTVAIVRRSKAGHSVSHLSFEISNSSQMAACSTPEDWVAKTRSEAPLNALGAYPYGYDDCLECQEFILVDDGGCDPIYIFWNTVTDQIDWWRA